MWNFAYIQCAKISLIFFITSIQNLCDVKFQMKLCRYKTVYNASTYTILQTLRLTIKWRRFMNSKRQTFLNIFAMSEIHFLIYNIHNFKTWFLPILKILFLMMLTETWYILSPRGDFVNNLLPHFEIKTFNNHIFIWRRIRNKFQKCAATYGSCGQRITHVLWLLIKLSVLYSSSCVLLMVGEIMLDESVCRRRNCCQLLKT